MSPADTKEITVDAAVATLLSKLDGIFAKNGTEGFSLWTTCSLFTPDWPWQEFSLTP